ncbi:MAG: replication endonuclease [Gammaproteobacteria bacterium]
MWHEFDTNSPQVHQADQLTSGYGTKDCRQFRQRIFNDLSPIAIDLAVRYAKIAERYDYEQANRELLKIHERLLIHDLNLCGSTDDLKQTANLNAEKCCFIRGYAKPLETYLECKKIVEQYGINPPPVKEGYEPAVNRMCCYRWWFRKIRNLRLRTLEEIARNIELVSRCRSTYASDYVIKLKRQQKEKNRLYLESTFVSNENGESYSLQELADRSVSNPAIRRAELMVRIKGFEMVAGLLGHVGEFYTLTVPSRMHACLHNGESNPRYDGPSPQKAQEYLTHLWSLIRSELHRRKIQPYGFRVVEPHHDGTPHWHLLLFMPPEHRETVREVMRNYALADSGNEPGAQIHRFKAIAIDPSQGTATGYIAKYIAKNIDGYALEQDLYGNDALEAAERITAWANTWGIRQFQQIGGPSVTVWRQLRKMEKNDDEELEVIRQTATASDWAAFMMAMGGPELPRSAHAIKPYYDTRRQLNLDTGEIVPALKGFYGDKASKQVAGVIFRTKDYDTRKHFWTIINGGSEERRYGCAAPAAQRTDSPQLPTLNLDKECEEVEIDFDRRDLRDPPFLAKGTHLCHLGHRNPF